MFNKKLLLLIAFIFSKLAYSGVSSDLFTEQVEFEDSQSQNFNLVNDPIILKLRTDIEKLKLDNKVYSEQIASITANYGNLCVNLEASTGDLLCENLVITLSDESPSAIINTNAKITN